MKLTKPKIYFMLGIVAVAIIVIYRLFFYGIESTDNAQVGGHVAVLSTKVSGIVTEVLVDENQKVKKGEVLVRLDQRDFVNARDQLAAELASTEARLTQSRKNFVRDQNLFEHKAIPSQEMELAQSQYDDMRAKADSIRTQLKESELNLEFSEIKAPEDGTIGKKSVEPGMVVSTTQPLMSFVSSRAKWITANYKETQLRRMRVGDYRGIILMTTFLSSLTVVLEEGSRKDWLGDPMIRNLSIVSSISFGLFLIHELRTKTPFINLRLLGRRNFAIATVAMAVFGFGAYGSIFILPFFLARVQNLNALDIGQIIMWSGLPQLLVLPFIPGLLRRFDNRVLASIGFFIFGTSALMNSQLTHDWGYDQFFWSQIVRAIGQPFIITPLSSLAYVGIEGGDIPSASGLFNMVRNLGGSIGIGILGTLLSERYQLHFTRIAESVTRYSFPVQEQLIRRAHYFNAHSPVGGLKQAIGSIYATFNIEAIVMSFSDCFLVLAITFFVCSGLIFFMKPAAKGAVAPVDAH